MVDDGTEVDCSWVTRQFIGLLNHLCNLVANAHPTLPERMTKVLLMLTQMTQVNERQFGVRSVPLSIEGWTYVPFFEQINGQLHTFEFRISREVKHTKKIINAKPWPMDLMKRFQGYLHLVQGIKARVNDLIPEGLADQYQGHYYGKPYQATLRRNIRKTKREVSRLERKLVAVINAHECRQKFIRKLKELKSLAQLLADCPDDHCVICQEKKLEENTNFATLDSCRHLFCVSCAKLCLRKRRECPMCRQKVTSSFSSFFIRKRLSRK